MLLLGEEGVAVCAVETQTKRPPVAYSPVEKFCGWTEERSSVFAGNRETTVTCSEGHGGVSGCL